jgi:dihydrofolate synthase/folylpolyglutamate synthase
VDGGHNPQCLDSLVDNLNTYFPDKKVSFITGVMADKDFYTMFHKILPLTKRVFTVTPDNHRALPAEKLAECFHAWGVREVKACANVEQSVKEALKRENEEGVICAVGTFYMAGAIRNMFVSV